MDACHEPTRQGHWTRGWLSLACCSALLTQCGQATTSDTTAADTAAGGTDSSVGDGLVGDDTSADGVAADAQATGDCNVEWPDHTVGVVRCQPGHAGGYVLYPAKHSGDVFLIDKLGRVIRHWKQSKLEPGQSCYLRPNGNLVRAAMLKGASNIGGGEGGRIEEYDWDDNLIWSFNYASNDAVTHHDFTILPNGNLLMLVVERKTKEQAAAVGFDTTHLDDGYVAPDAVIEVKKTGADTFEIVWQWHVWDHLVSSNPALGNYGDPKLLPERLHVSGGAPAFWNHVNSIHYNAQTDQIVLSARSHNEAWVIDHSTTTEEAAGSSGGKYKHGGEFLYRWGNPVNYGGGTAQDRKLFNQHDVQWIDAGLPGAGHFLVFNNGLDRPGPLGNYSTIDEWISPANPDGSFPAIQPGQAYGPTGVAWEYVADPPTDFYSSEISGAQRLNNGNTLVFEGTKGQFLEVTPAGAIVWKYRNPMRTAGPMTQYEQAPLDPKGHPESAVFKGHWYPADFSGFSGHDMTPIADRIEATGTDCPVSNTNYSCTTSSACTAQGGTPAPAALTCQGGATCCFKLAMPAKGPNP